MTRKWACTVLIPTTEARDSELWRAFHDQEIPELVGDAAERHGATLIGPPEITYHPVVWSPPNPRTDWPGGHLAALPGQEPEAVQVVLTYDAEDAGVSQVDA